MAINLTGISNENEFYSHHYLSAILENDLRELFARWSSQEEQSTAGDKPSTWRSPYAKIGGLAKLYFVLRNRLEKTTQPEGILQDQHEFFAALLDALGYPYSIALKSLDEGSVPILGEIKKNSGAPDLWILETIGVIDEVSDPINLNFDICQYRTDGFPPVEEKDRFLDTPISELITAGIFSQAEPPRWLLVLNFHSLVLIDRSKWNEKRFLRFDFAEILSRKEASTLKAMAALLHRDSLCPDDGSPLLDILDENSHKHAFEVSEDLKYSVREAIELLGNETIWFLRNQRKKGVFGESETAEKIDPEQLTRECLRYLYRLLFVLYIEARPELGYAPIRKSEQYAKGYSFESLRDLELVPLTTDESRNGYFIHESVQILFTLIFEGFNSRPETAEIFRTGADAFSLVPLKSHLFDKTRTPLLEKVRLRNSVLQQVVQLLSLSRPKGGHQRRGRISYAQLGINQLGAVYEGLLSYTGFFAAADLYEVQPTAKKKKNGGDGNQVEEEETTDGSDSPRQTGSAETSKRTDLNPGYFVTSADLGKYNTDEKVFNSDGTLRMHPKGEFIYRLSGRTREKSASFYTPEVLTKCLVKYSLEELLKDKKADDLLHLTVCEMALGSGAFANEAVTQLAEAYLDCKQRETGCIIPHEEYGREKQKVKMFIADHNVFGVDLNPVAVELAEISLWLNTIFDGAYVPWFGMQLVAGNSLIGARRQVFPASRIIKQERSAPSWLDLIPRRSPLKIERAGDELAVGDIFHFLLPDSGMAKYNDKVVKQMAPIEMDQIKTWRKEFIQPFDEGEVTTLLRYSKTIEKLWRKHAEQQQQIRERTSDILPVFGQKEAVAPTAWTTTQDKDKIHQQEFLSENVRNSSPYRRLKLVMDYWCALWFWPIEKANLLPTRDQFLMDLSLIIEGEVYEPQPQVGDQLKMFAETVSVEDQLKLVDEFGFVDVCRLCHESPRLRLISELAQVFRFHHWELEFADLFATRGGFDLLVGNPPWIKLEWNEGGLLGDYEPLFLLRKFSAADMANIRRETIENRGIRSQYLNEFAEMTAAQNFLNSNQNYPFLQGTQANLYKCFLPQAWTNGNSRSVSGFLHPEGIYDDPNGGILRASLYPRLKSHFQFQNGLNLFAEVPHRQKFSINIHSGRRSNEFVHISNLFHPATLIACFHHDGSGVCEGIKTEEGAWNLNGHRDRIIKVDANALEIFAKLFDSVGTPREQATLPVIHSRQVMEVLAKVSRYPARVAQKREEYHNTEMWHETNSEKDGTIKRSTQFPGGIEGLILSGPHLYVGNPCYKTPRAICSEKADYDVVTLDVITDSYLPRTNYMPACDPVTYRHRVSTVEWEADVHTTDFYRLAFRGMLPTANERTLIGAIIPKGVAHINGLQSTAFKSESLLVRVAAFGISIVADFFIKTIGRTNLHYSWEAFPLLESCTALAVRTLVLNCLTTHYTELWSKGWMESFMQERWAKSDSRLDDGCFAELTPQWKRTCALRTDYARRQALIEIDVLVARALGFTLDELRSIYRVQFPVLRQNENDTWYDRRGRIVFTCSKGLPGVGFSRAKWNEIKELKVGSVERRVTEDFLPGGPRECTLIYEAPFDRCEREQDYATAWKEFESRAKA